MAYIKLYDTPFTISTGENFDNSPSTHNSINNKSDAGVFRNVNWDNLVESLNGNILTQTVTEMGHTYTFRILYDYYNRIQTVTGSVDGQTVLVGRDINVPYSEWILLDGEALQEYAYSGDDIFEGASGNDRIWGYSGDDILYGNGGNDVLHGGNGDDILFGGNGNDYLYGWGGKDTNHGGAGYDYVYYFGKIFDYALSKDPATNIITITWENGFDKGTIYPDVEAVRFEGSKLEIKTDSILYTGVFSGVKSGAVDPIYRFYNIRDKAFFYTDSAAETESVIFNSNSDRPDELEWPYVYQGSTFEAAHSYLDSSTLTPVFRFYNYKTGHHFYTVSEEEANNVKARSASGEWPFNYEGTGFLAYSSDPNPNSTGQELAIHRFYSESLDRHFFTGDPQEVESVKLTGLWNYEGIGFWGEILG